VETLGHPLSVGDIAIINAGAPRGTAGLWLLDPTNLTVTTADANITITGGGSVIRPAASPATGVNTTIQKTLNSGSGVQLSTNASPSSGENGDIIVNASRQQHRHDNV